MQKLIYPTKYMNISQNYDGTFSHYSESHGNPTSFPIDECCKDAGRDYFYAPCDLIVKRMYGVGNGGSNTIWLESCEKVKLANGTESFVTIRVTHPEDDDLSKIKVGQKFKQYDAMFREGRDGYATGNHFHICVNNCKFSELSNNGWVRNNKGSWVTSPHAIKPEQAFYVNKDFTKIINSKYLKFSVLTGSTSENKQVNTNILYVVKKGDTLSKIAKIYNTTWQKIYNDNKAVIGNNPNFIQIGMKLKIN